MWVGYLKEAQLSPRFGKSLNLQNSSLVGSFKKINAFLSTLYALMKLFTINGVYIKTAGKLKMVFKTRFFLTLAKLRLNPCKSEVKGAIYHVAIATVIFPHEKLSSCFRSKVHLLFVWCLYNHDTVEPRLEPRYYGHEI